MASLHLGQTAYLCIHGLLHRGGVHSQLLEDEPCDLLGHLHHAAQQMLRLNGLLPLALYALESFLHCLLGFDGVFVHVHILSPFFSLMFLL